MTNSTSETFARCGNVSFRDARGRAFRPRGGAGQGKNSRGVAGQKSVCECEAIIYRTEFDLSLKLPSKF